MEVILEQKLLIFVLNEVLRVALPRAQIDLAEEDMGDEFEDLAGSVLSGLLFLEIRLRQGRVHHVSVELTRPRNLWLQVLKFDRGDEDPNSIRVASRIALIAPSIEAVNVDNLEGGDEG